MTQDIRSDAIDVATHVPDAPHQKSRPANESTGTRWHFPEGRSERRKRVALILPVEYRGGSLRAAKLVAQAIHIGSRQWREPADVVFAHLDAPQAYPDEIFDDLPEGIARRPYVWRELQRVEARRAMLFAGRASCNVDSEQYLMPDDGINNLLDCDVWIFISDRLSAPVLPLRPRIHIVYDYIQRYVPVISSSESIPYLEAVRNADRILVTTEFTKMDALQYAGVAPNRLFKVPMLVRVFSSDARSEPSLNLGYFLWPTNLAPHKNHAVAVETLEHYYNHLHGTLSCHVTGVGTERILDYTQSPILRDRVRLLGELSDDRYRTVLARAAFVWHPTRIDNGTFSVVEAASLGVPALSSDYPAMREIDDHFALNLAWSEPDDCREMATMLKMMEDTHKARRHLLPTKARLEKESLENHANDYWRVIRQCL